MVECMIWEILLWANIVPILDQPTSYIKLTDILQACALNVGPLLVQHECLLQHWATICLPDKISFRQPVYFTDTAGESTVG